MPFTSISSGNGPFLYVVAPSGNFTSIQNAIDNAVADGYSAIGTTISLAAGIYTENLVLAPNINLVGSAGEEEVQIVGVHTPPATGTFIASNIIFTSATDVLFSDAAGTCDLKFYDCIFNCDLGYVANVALWKGAITIESCSDISISNGIVFNNGAAEVNIADSVLGSGVVGYLLSGLTTIRNSHILCVGTFTANANALITDSTFKGTITVADPATARIFNSSILVKAVPCLIDNSTQSVQLGNVVLDSSGADALTGTGASLELGEVVYLNTASYSGLLTIVRTNECASGNLRAYGNISLPATEDTGLGGILLVDSAPFLHAMGTDNTFLGAEAGNLGLTVGSAIQNVGIGNEALHDVTSGSTNCAMGDWALHVCTTSSGNVALGRHALVAITTAPTDGRNVAVGSSCMALATTAERNVAVGSTALAITTGVRNIVLGYGAGTSLVGAESSNIIIGSTGTAGDANTIRIGTQGAGVGQQDKTYVAGVYQASSGATKEMVYIDSTGKLSSSNVGSTQWTTATVSGAITVNTSYVIKIAVPGLLSLTLPAIAVLGDMVEIVGYSAGGWSIVQNALQSVRLGAVTSTIGVGGSVSSTLASDSIKMVCIVAGASTEWAIIYAVGNPAIV
jgi:hypothetical protein